MNGFSSNSSQSGCSNCAKYEEDILLLQEKLMDTHSKLIDQMDICRDQQMAILKLSQAQTMENEQSHSNVTKSRKNEEMESILLNKN